MSETLSPAEAHANRKAARAIKKGGHSSRRRAPVSEFSPMAELQELAGVAEAQGLETPPSETHEVVELKNHADFLDVAKALRSEKVDAMPAFELIGNIAELKARGHDTSEDESILMDKLDEEFTNANLTFDEQQEKIQLVADMIYGTTPEPEAATTTEASAAEPAAVEPSAEKDDSADAELVERAMQVRADALKRGEKMSIADAIVEATNQLNTPQSPEASDESDADEALKESYAGATRMAISIRDEAASRGVTMSHAEAMTQARGKIDAMNNLVALSQAKKTKAAKAAATSPAAEPVAETVEEPVSPEAETPVTTELTHDELVSKAVDIRAEGFRNEQEISLDEAIELARAAHAESQRPQEAPKAEKGPRVLEIPVTPMALFARAKARSMRKANERAEMSSKERKEYDRKHRFIKLGVVAAGLTGLVLGSKYGMDHGFLGGHNVQNVSADTLPPLDLSDQPFVQDNGSLADTLGAMAGKPNIDPSVHAAAAEFSAKAHEVTSGEGLYSTMSQINIPADMRHAVMEKAGPGLVKAHKAYLDTSTGEYRLFEGKLSTKHLRSIYNAYRSLR